MAMQPLSSDSVAAVVAAAPPTNQRAPASPVMTLRGYQSRIAKTCEDANTIVILPTGSGKTLIAAELIKRLHGGDEKAAPALFLVPTCILVDQQANALRSWTGLVVAKYRGGVALPGFFNVLVSTPEAFKVAQRRNRAGTAYGTAALLDWGLFSAVIFDEVGLLYHGVSLPTAVYSEVCSSTSKLSEGPCGVLQEPAYFCSCGGRSEVH